MIRRLIRSWLGIEAMITHINASNQLHYATHAKLNHFQEVFAEPIAKLSAIMSDEHSAARKAASDMIGAEALKRAQAEDKARRHTLGETF